VTLCITLVEEGPRRLIHVAGRLTHEEVSELERVIGSNPISACLVLKYLRSADASGLAALRRLRGAGVPMRSIPPHLRWRIEDEDVP
jgi:hypothetical protein